MSDNSAQESYLRAGGPLQGVLQQKYEKGELNPNYSYAEYPKMLRISKGVQHFERQSEKIQGNTTVLINWSEDKEVFDDIIVQNEEEEERVLSGGKTEAQVEDDRQALIQEAKSRGLRVDPSWGMVRLQRELGSAPTNETIVALQRQVADLEEKASLRARIQELEARLAQPEAAPQVYSPRLYGESSVNQVPWEAGQSSLNPAPKSADERDPLREQLRQLDVEVDMRWGIARLRDELAEATAK